MIKWDFEDNPWNDRISWLPEILKKILVRIESRWYLVSCCPLVWTLRSLDLSTSRTTPISVSTPAPRQRVRRACIDISGNVLTHRTRSSRLADAPGRWEDLQHAARLCVIWTRIKLTWWTWTQLMFGSNKLPHLLIGNNNLNTPLDWK